MTAAVGEGLAIEAAEREPLLAEIDRFAGALAAGGEPKSGDRYGRLREAVAAGAVPAELVGVLEGLLEIALGSRSVRHFHGPAAERALVALYGRTPRGAAVEEGTRAANRALEAIRGQRVERLTFQPGLPGEHRLVVETERCRITFEIGPDGVAARDVAL